MSDILPTPTGPYPTSFTDILDKPGVTGTFFRIYYPTKNFDAANVTFPQWMEPEYFKQLSQFMSGIDMFPLAVPLNLPASLPANLQKLPVILFSHGLLLSKDSYSFVCSDLASYGFLVAAVDHKDGSAAGSLYLEESGSDDENFVRKCVEMKFVPFGSEEEKIERTLQVDTRVKELMKVLDALEQLNQGVLLNIYYPKYDLSVFKEKLELDKVAVIGHSHGGASAALAVIKDDRIKLACPLDPWMLVFDDKYLKEKADKPMLFINCIGEVKKRDIIKIRQLDSDVTGISAERTMVTLLGTSHFTQSDFCYLPQSFLKRLKFDAKNDAKFSNAINTKLILTFLRKHLDLPGDKDINSVVNEYANYVMHGTDLAVTEEEITEAKAKVASAFQSNDN